MIDTSLVTLLTSDNDVRISRCKLGAVRYDMNLCNAFW